MTKCKECKWLNLNEKTSIGYVCEHPDREYPNTSFTGLFSRVAHLKPLSTKACKRYEERDTE